MDQETIINYTVMFIVLGALAVGLLSMLFGKLLELFDAILAWWRRGVVKAIHYRPVEKPRYNMSSSFKTYRRTSIEPLKSTLVRPDTDAERTSTANQNVPVHEPAHEPDIISAKMREMSDSELIVWLAVLRKPDGTYRFTANKVYDIVGGTRKDVLAAVAELRESKKTENKPAGNHSLQRPAKGW